MHDRIWFAQLLRGLAALLVMYRHLAVAFWANNAHLAPFAGVAALDAVPRLPHLALTRLGAKAGVSSGPLGVAVFFLISGFVIPFSLQRLRPGAFLLQRIFRLYPTYAIGLAFTCAVMAAYAAWHGTPYHVRWIDYLGHVSLCRDWFGMRGIDGIVWTLEVELKFYLICAGLCLFTTLRRATPLVAVGTILAAVCWLSPRPLLRPLVVLIGAAPYLPYMFLGTCAFNHHHGHWSARKALAVGALLGGLSVLCFAGSAPVVALTPGLFAGSYGLGLAAFVALYAAQKHVPRSAALDWLANVSYPLYVVHGVAGYVLLTVLTHAGVPAYAAIGLTMALALLVAHALHHLVEKPGVALGKALLRKPTPVVTPATRRAA